MKDNKIILENCSIIDAKNHQPSKPCNVLIEGNKIKDITFEECSDSNSSRINLKNHYLMPGLIDNHVHVSATQFDLHDDDIQESYRAIQAKEYLEQMLQRGFTSVRDAGGADYGLQLATEKDLIKGPRIFLSCKALSQTGGHGDFYSRNHPFQPCFCHLGGSSLSIVADGVAAVRKATREQIRTGANQIKIMASGGVASPTDNIQNVQYSVDEIKAIVDEANHAGIYVMAHAYAPAAIKRCIESGVRTIEHGNLLDHETAVLMRKAGAFLVPTTVIYHAIANIGKEEGFPDESLAKLEEVLSQAIAGIKIARNAKVKIGLGTDLLGPKAHKMQSQEFIIRKDGGETEHEIICSATAINAEILQQENMLGLVEPGYYADLIAVNANPLDDISLLAGQGENLSLIIKDGKIYKNVLGN